MAHRDPTAPWLDTCETDSTDLCWYAMSGSGGRVGGEQQSAMVLWKTDYLISTECVFVKNFFSHAHPGVYSCPDFFRLPGSDTFVFGSLDGDYFLGSYSSVASNASTTPTFTPHNSDSSPSRSFNGLGIWKTGGWCQQCDEPNVPPGFLGDRRWLDRSLGPSGIHTFTTT